MENDLKGNENHFELTGGSSYRGFELPVVLTIFSLADCFLILFRRKLMFVTSWGLKGLTGWE